VLIFPALRGVLKTERMSLFASITTYFKDSWEELKKVSWPTRRDTITNSVLVIVISLGVAIFFGLLDFIFTKGLEFLLNR